ncbi:MAG TPA: alpha/beta hydrolase [Bryobacteraceae bacterium]|jgi:pimeloyl-ACP methyl ester carboxylesterase
MSVRYIIGLVLSLSLSAATVDGLNIHSTTTGTGTKTVILVHGWTCDETTWTEQVPALAKQYRVVTLDLPGHGKSDSPKDGKFSMDLFARAIEAVRADVKADRVVLVGHSMGSPVVIRYAQLYPQHTVALVLVDGLMPSLQTPPTKRSVAMAGAAGRTNRTSMIRSFFSVSTTPALQTKILDMMLAPSEATAVGAMDATDEAITPADWSIAVPTLGLYASRPLAARQTIQTHFPNSEYQQIPDTGHFLMLEKPAEFNALLLPFLAKQKY